MRTKPTEFKSWQYSLSDFFNHSLLVISVTEVSRSKDNEGYVVMSGAVIWKAAVATLAPPSGQKAESSVARGWCVFAVCVCAFAPSFLSHQVNSKLK